MQVVIVCLFVSSKVAVTERDDVTCKRSGLCAAIEWSVAFRLSEQGQKLRILGWSICPATKREFAKGEAAKCAR